MPTWTEKLSVGNAAIDKQHKELFAQADALLAAMHQGKPAAEVTEMIKFIDSYCGTHFATEEQLMRARAYPGLQEHLRAHASFVKQFEAIVAQFTVKGPSIGVTVSLQQLISGWLVQHVGTIDKKLGAFIKEPPKPEAR